MSKSERQALDFEKICRLCLLEKRSMSAIFSKKKGDRRVPLPVRIMSCAALELYEGDGLPSSICNKCLLSVNQSFAFREQCEQADSTLRQYVQRMNETHEEPTTTREPWERIANISLEPIADVGIKSKEGNGDGRGGGGDGGGVEEKNVVEQDEKCHKGKNANKLFGVGLSSFMSEEHSSLNAKGDSVSEQGLGAIIGLSKYGRKKGSSSTKAKSLGFNERTKLRSDENSDVERVGVEKKMRVFNYERIGLNESDVKEEKGRSVSPTLRTCFKEKAENVILVTDIETISANFLSGMKNEHGDDLKRSIFLPAVYECEGNPCGRETAVGNNPKGKSNSVNDVHLQLQKLINNKEIVVQKRESSKILVVKKESEPTMRQKHESVQDFEVAQSVTETDVDLPRAGSSSEYEIAKKFVPKQRNKPEIILEEFSDEESKNDEGGKQKWKHGKDVVFCKECKIFLLRSSYCNHIKFVHKKVRKYLCQSCGYAACTGTILRQHVQAVHGGYSFYCDQCPRTFNLMKRLRRHMEVEHLRKPVERNHVCQYCGMAFTKPACLKRHLRSHTQETPYQCRYCHRRFKYHWPKVQHERLHTGEKPYKCSFCDERFTQNCVRKLHEYKKHGNEEFKPKTQTKKVVIKRIRRTMNTKKQHSEDF